MTIKLAASVIVPIAEANLRTRLLTLMKTLILEFLSKVL